MGARSGWDRDLGLRRIKSARDTGTLQDVSSARWMRPTFLGDRPLGPGFLTHALSTFCRGLGFAPPHAHQKLATPLECCGRGSGPQAVVRGLTTSMVGHCCSDCVQKSGSGGRPKYRFEGGVRVLGSGESWHRASVVMVLRLYSSGIVTRSARVQYWCCATLTGASAVQVQYRRSTSAEPAQHQRSTTAASV